MSASEKLKALKHPTYIDVSQLAIVFSQIIAVVEAAEFARGWPEMPSDLRWEDFDAALAALDEALP